MLKIFYYTQDYKNTNSKENAFYWIEVDHAKQASFYKKGLLSEPFYKENIDNTADDQHLKSYLKILLKAITMIQEN